MQLVIMQGLSGSGKSRIVERDYAATFQVVCLDDLRRALGHPYHLATETMVLAIAEAMVRSHLIGGRDLVIDDTHTRMDNALRWRCMGWRAGYQVWLHRVECPLEECVRRRRGRVERPNIERMARNLAAWDINLATAFDRVITEEGKEGTLLEEVC